MKKVLICNIPMQPSKGIPLKSYGNDSMVEVSDRPVRYPANAFLADKLTKDTELKVILLLMNGNYSDSEENARLFSNELSIIAEETGASIEIVRIETTFSQSKETHEYLMGRIVDEIDPSMHIIADITFGPKDLPIIVFSVLSFAEKFLNCEIDGIIYGQAEFKNHQVINSKIYDLTSLFYLSTITNSIKETTPDKAKILLHSLIAMR